MVAMNQQQANQFNEAMRNFKNGLHGAFTETTIPKEPLTMFLLQEKLPPGQRSPEGGRYKTYHKITLQQADIIACTSQGVAEMELRIRKQVLEGIDTTQYQASANAPPADGLFNKDQVEQLVKQALIEAMKQQAGTMPVKTVEQTAAEAVTPVEHTEKPSGLQHKKRKSVKAYQEDSKKKIEFYRRQTELLGVDPPIMLKSNPNRIDKRWLWKHKKRWEKHMEGKPITAGEVIES